MSSYKIWELAQRVLAFATLVIISPLLLTISLWILAQEGMPVMFWQRRVGKNGKHFWMAKFRTMRKDAEEMKNKYLSRNEADGPVFKIRNDPRFTKTGKWLSWSGLDELPQLWNVTVGQMNLVGPRPLPVDEAEKVIKKYNVRFTVLPGMTSRWVVKGNHVLSFDEWMRLDENDIKSKSVKSDFSILWETAKQILGMIRRGGRIRKNKYD